MSAPWESRRWRWQAPGHIMLLESKGRDQLYPWSGAVGPPRLLRVRNSGFPDSSLGLVLKGRSASRAIQRALQLTNPLLLAGGILPT